MPSRDDFRCQQQNVRRIARQEGLVLAVVSVGFGIAQLVFLWWAESNLERAPRIAIALPTFLVYIGLVMVLVLRMKRRILAATPTCPACATPLTNMAEQVASATGKCSNCGGTVFETANPAKS